MSIKRMFETAPNADALSDLRHNRKRTVSEIQGRCCFAAAGRA